MKVGVRFYSTDRISVDTCESRLLKPLKKLCKKAVLIIIDYVCDTFEVCG